MVFERIRETRALIHFVHERLPHYGPLVSGDLQRFREEIVRATVGACVALVAGLMFICLLSAAAIVSAWDTPYRTATAWLVCAAWAGLTLVGLGLARKAIAVPPPFHLVGTALAQDYARLTDLIASPSGKSDR